jgi:hypothetical protein
MRCRSIRTTHPQRRGPHRAMHKHTTRAPLAERHAPARSHSGTHMHVRASEASARFSCGQTVGAARCSAESPASHRTARSALAGSVTSTQTAFPLGARGPVLGQVGKKALGFMNTLLDIQVTLPSPPAAINCRRMAAGLLLCF